MLEKFKNLKSRISIFINTGYWNPKYVFLALLTEENDEECRNLLWRGANQYINKGDKVFDKLFLAMNGLEAFRKIYGKGEKKEDE